MQNIHMLLLRLTPGQGGGIWLFLFISFLIVGDLKNLRSKRNLTLLLLLVPALPLVDIMEWEPKLGDPKLGWLLGAAFTALYAITAFMTAWAVALAFRKLPHREPNLSVPHLKLILGFVVFANVFVVMGRNPEDSGPYTSIGARRWLETGRLPYGDEKLRGDDAPGYGAAATYGPALYVAHVPFQFLTLAKFNDADMDPMDTAYIRPPLMATRLTCLAFQIVGLIALYGIGNRLRGPPTGCALAILYGISPYVLGLGGYKNLIGGLAFISHIAPNAMMLAAFAALHRPALSGVLLAIAAGCLFYPAFFFPLFFGWFLWNKAGALRFTMGFGLMGLAIAIFVIGFTGSIGDDGPVKLFLQSTLEHQEGVGGQEYGASKFSFWGTYPGLAAVLQKPLTGSSSVFKPMFLFFASLCCAAFFLVKGRSVSQFALLVAFLGAGIQLWKTHAGGTYVEWYLPFLLIGLFAAVPPGDGTPEPTPAPAT